MTHGLLVNYKKSDKNPSILYVVVKLSYEENLVAFGKSNNQNPSLP